MNKEPTCTETVFPREAYGAFHGHDCGAKAKFKNAKGEPRCKRHSDEAVAERDAKMRAKWQAEQNERADRADAAAARDKLIAMIPDMLVAMRQYSASDEWLQTIEQLWTIANKRAS